MFIYIYCIVIVPGAHHLHSMLLRKYLYRSSNFSWNSICWVASNIFANALVSQQMQSFTNSYSSTDWCACIMYRLLLNLKKNVWMNIMDWWKIKEENYYFNWFFCLFLRQEKLDFFFSLLKKWNKQCNDVSGSRMDK